MTLKLYSDEFAARLPFLEKQRTCKLRQRFFFNKNRTEHNSLRLPKIYIELTGEDI